MNVVPSRGFRLAVVAAAATLLMGVAAQETPAVRLNADRSGLMVDGYDVVAYFTDGRPTKGTPEFEREWHGVKWRFASAANRDAFAASPEKFAPAYGGFCAYAVSRNYTADTDPQAWEIVDGRLILNYSLQVRSLFQRDTPGNIRKADANWPALSRTNKLEGDR
jgi:hypothetical protein